MSARNPLAHRSHRAIVFSFFGLGCPRSTHLAYRSFRVFSVISQWRSRSPSSCRSDNFFPHSGQNGVSCRLPQQGIPSALISRNPFLVSRVIQCQKNYSLKPPPPMPCKSGHSAGTGDTGYTHASLSPTYAASRSRLPLWGSGSSWQTRSGPRTAHPCARDPDCRSVGLTSLFHRGDQKEKTLPCRAMPCRAWPCSPCLVGS